MSNNPNYNYGYTPGGGGYGQQPQPNQPGYQQPGIPVPPPAVNGYGASSGQNYPPQSQPPQHISPVSAAPSGGYPGGGYGAPVPPQPSAPQFPGQVPNPQTANPYPSNNYPTTQQPNQFVQPQYPTSQPMQHPRLPQMSQAPIMPMGNGPLNMRPISMPVPVIGQSPPLGELHRVPTVPVQPSNANEYVRSTLTKIPKSNAVFGKTKLSFGVTFTPFPPKADPVPLATGAIVRCNRCRTYLNPYAEIIDQGSRWKCNLCYAINDFPVTYDYDPNTQQQFDRRNKAELNSPVYEYIAPMEYMNRPPQAPSYLFLIDVTHSAVQSGMVATATRTIMDTLDQLPNSEGRTRVGIITYDSALHFYNFANGEPRMLIVADTSDVFLPSDERDLLVNLNECRSHLETLLEAIPGYFAHSSNNQSAMGSAVQAAVKLIGHVGGKVIILQASSPTVGEGGIKPRDDPKTYGTSAESALLRPSSTFYKLQATECSRPEVQVCFDMFLCPGHGVSLDLATIGNISKYTGGKIFYYSNFNAGRSEDAIKLASDLSTFLSKEVCFEAVIRIRASQGLTVNSYYGNFFLRSSDLLSLPNVNLDHSYTAQIILDDTLMAPLACFQTAVLHTTCHGERRIRVINAAYPVTDVPEDLYDGVDQAIEKAVTGSLEEARDALTNKLVDISKAVSATYKLGANGQLMIPEPMRLVPSLINGLLRSHALRNNTTSIDQRSFASLLMRTLSVPQTLEMLLPHFWAVHSLDQTSGLPDSDTGIIQLPPRMPLTSERLERHGLFVLDDGQTVYLWLGSQAHPELCNVIFGAPYTELESGKISLPALDNTWSQRLNNILSKRREIYPYSPTVILVKEDSPDAMLRMSFLAQLTDDRSPDGQQPSLAQWLGVVREKASQ